MYSDASSRTTGLSLYLLSMLKQYINNKTCTKMLKHYTLHVPVQVRESSKSTGKCPNGMKLVDRPENCIL